MLESDEFIITVNGIPRAVMIQAGEYLDEIIKAISRANAEGAVVKIGLLSVMNLGLDTLPEEETEEKICRARTKSQGMEDGIQRFSYSIQFIVTGLIPDPVRSDRIKAGEKVISYGIMREKLLWVILMSIAKEELHKMIDQLSEDEWYSAYEFMYFLIYRSRRRLSWEDIDHLPSDSENFNDDEKKQFEAAEEYIALDAAIVEYDL